MTVWTITVEQLSTGATGNGGIVRCDTIEQARAHAEAGFAAAPNPSDWRVVAITERTYRVAR